MTDLVEECNFPLEKQLVQREYCWFVKIVIRSLIKFRLRMNKFCWMDPSFHVVYTKFWSYCANVAAEIETLATFLQYSIAQTEANTFLFFMTDCLWGKDTTILERDPNNQTTHYKQATGDSRKGKKKPFLQEEKCRKWVCNTHHTGLVP